MFGVPIGRTPVALAVGRLRGRRAVLATSCSSRSSRRPRAADSSCSSMIVFPLMMIGGSFFPLEVMPAWMARIGRWTPNGLGVAQLKEILFGHPDLSDARGRGVGDRRASRRSRSSIAAPASARPVRGELMSLLECAWFVATKDVALPAATPRDDPLDLRDADRLLLLHRHRHRRIRPDGRSAHDRSPCAAARTAGSSSTSSCAGSRRSSTTSSGRTPTKRSRRSRAVSRFPIRRRRTRRSPRPRSPDEQQIADVRAQRRSAGRRTTTRCASRARCTKSSPTWRSSE